MLSLTLVLCMLAALEIHVTASSEQVEIPEAPRQEEVPGMPEQAEMPKAPAEQESPEQVEMPEAPAEQESPKQAEVPDTSDTPEQTEKPEAPEQPELTALATIEAKVYLLYDNRVPGRINDPFDAAGFGPAGDNTPYITVTLDLNQVVKNGGVLQRKNSSEYYSIDSPGYAYNGSRTTAMKGYWEKILYPAIEVQDRSALDAVFGGKNNFYGYVLKQENDGWHIDGLLVNDSPVYVVELYDYSGGTNKGTLFAISAYGSDRTGVTYESFRQNLKTALGGTEYTDTDQKTDRLEFTYQKDGKSFRALVSPKHDEAESQAYHMYPDTNRFAYRAITKDIYYISRMKLEIQEVIKETTSLSLTKMVNGSAANPSEHFKFTLYAIDEKGAALEGSVSLKKAGMDGCTQTHGDTLTFTEGRAEVLLKAQEQITLEGLPRGGEVKVTEEAEAYQATVKVNGKEVALQETGLVLPLNEQIVTAVFVNKKLLAPPTGITVEILPLLLLTAGGMAAGGLTQVRRRKRAS